MKYVPFRGVSFINIIFCYVKMKPPFCVVDKHLILFFSPILISNFKLLIFSSLSEGEKKGRLSIRSFFPMFVSARRLHILLLVVCAYFDPGPGAIGTTRVIYYSRSWIKLTGVLEKRNINGQSFYFHYESFAFFFHPLHTNEAITRRKCYEKMRRRIVTTAYTTICPIILGYSYYNTLMFASLTVASNEEASFWRSGTSKQEMEFVCFCIAVSRNNKFFLPDS